ncbi:hypothetical protein MTYM_00569 [Methylococcales bacterium]|nr:hypothetical protein MTYM_00569 [Methylococcales bacterium]
MQCLPEEVRNPRAEDWLVHDKDTLYSLVYGAVSFVSINPLEKKTGYVMKVLLQRNHLI